MEVWEHLVYKFDNNITSFRKEYQCTTVYNYLRLTLSQEVKSVNATLNKAEYQQRY